MSRLYNILMAICGKLPTFSLAETSNSASIAASGSVWINHNIPQGYDKCYPIGFYLTGVGGYVYAITPTSSAVKNLNTTAATAKVTIHWLCIKFGDGTA